MDRRCLVFFLIGFIFFALFPGVVKAKQIKIFADTLEFDLNSESLQGKGRIKVQYGQTFFQADEC